MTGVPPDHQFACEVCASPHATVVCMCFRPEADGQDAITVQEDELVAAEWQTLAQFEANPFPKDIPLLGQVWEPWLRRASVNISLCDA